MKYDEFIGQVQHRARLDSRGAAVRATRAVLEVLAERIHPGERSNLCAQLPEEIALYLERNPEPERFGLDEFFERVSEHEGSPPSKAVHHARAVISVLQDAVSSGQIEDVRAQLPEEYAPLFESGSEGTMPTS